MSDYVYLKNLNGQQIKPVTDLAAINMTTTNGIGVSTVNGGTIGIIDGYIESAYYTEMADPAVGAANVSSAYVDGGTAVAILGAYTVASAVDTAAPSQQKVPSEKAVVDALNNVVVSGVSYYAGTGINIDQGHTVSVANVPQSSVAGLENTLTGINTAVAAKQDAISAGYRMSLDGTTLNQKRYFDIESPTSATITLQAGHAYKITATNSSKTLDSEQIPANQFGLEGHAEIFVAGTGLIKTTSNVVLAQALEPDAVNNCTVRFHDGKAIISVEDHVAGYIVVSASGTTAGTLPYALSTASNEYISFDASLNNMTLDFGGAVTNSEKHVVGNGYTETVISGGINCTSKTTLSNLAANGVVVSSGTLTMGDVFIPSGATVAVSGGGLAIEKVSGNGGVINLNGNHVLTFPSKTAGISSVTITGYSNTTQTVTGPVYAMYLTTGTSVNLSNVDFANNSGGLAACVSVDASPNATVNLSGCTFGATNFGPMFFIRAGTVNMTDCTLDSNANGYGQMYVGASGTVKFGGTNVFRGKMRENYGGTVTISSGAIVDLTGNTNPTPINPGGGVTFAEGGATVYPSAGQASAYMLGGVTVPQIGNTNVIDLGGKNVSISSGCTAYASGCTFSGGSAAYGGAFYVITTGNINLVSCIVTGNSASGRGGAFYVEAGAHVVLTGTTVSSNSNSGGCLTIQGGCTWSITDCTFEIGQSFVLFAGASHFTFSGTNKIKNYIYPSGGSVNITIATGTVLDFTGNTASVPVFDGNITVETGGCTIINASGTSISLAAGTYTKINKDGTTTAA